MEEKKPTVRLIHWKAEEAKELVNRLTRYGYVVDYGEFVPKTIHRIRENPPDAAVIDLSRLPSQGRDFAMALRSYKATRNIPIVFVDGDPEKVARFKQQLPDAVYARWENIRGSLSRAIVSSPTAASVPRTRLEGYSGAPLWKKLGIKERSTVNLVGAPQGWEKTLSGLPKGAVVGRDLEGQSDLIIWFAKSLRELETKIDQITRLHSDGGLWIAWKKKRGASDTDLSQALVRRVGLASGLVDYKICSFDETWSGLRFARRISKAASR